MTTEFAIREAQVADRAVIIEFNALLAQETEGKSLDLTVLAQGVEAALTGPDRLRYWVAEPLSRAGILGQAAVSREWSDWRNGWVWWFQSVYVRPESRRLGVFRSLFQAIRDCALSEPDVIGLRLYVEAENRRAQDVYQALGMKPGGYHVYEALWTERFHNSGPTGSGD